MSVRRELDKKVEPLTQINLNDRPLLKEEDLKRLVIDPLRQNPSIRKVFLSRSRLRAPTLKKILKEVNGHQGVVIVNLKENALGGDPQLFKSLLSSFPNLEELDLNDTQLSADGIAALSQAIEHAGSFLRLKRLDVGYNRLGDAGLTPLLKAIARPAGVLAKTQWDLRLAGNLLTGKTVDQLIKLLKENQVQFKYLLLDNNPAITPEKMAELQHLLASAPSPLSGRPSSSVFDFTNHALSSSQVPLLATSLRQDPAVRKVLLSGNALGGPESMHTLWGAIRTQGQVQELDLSHNAISLAGIKILSEGLLSDKELLVLKLSGIGVESREGHKLSPESVSVLANAIARHPSLTHLDLEGNVLGDEGVAIMAEACIGHPSLVSINLKNNQFGSRGGMKLLRLFQQNAVTRARGRAVPLRELHISREPGLRPVLYDAIHQAVRFFGWLPYQERLVLQSAAPQGKYLLALDQEKSLLEFISQFIQQNLEAKADPAPSSSPSPAGLIEECAKRIKSTWREQLLNDAKSYLKEHVPKPIFDVEFSEASRKIDALCAVYSEPETLKEWFKDPQQALAKLNPQKNEIQKRYDACKVELEPHTEAVLQVQEEMNQALAWRFILYPVPSVLGEQELAVFSEPSIAALFEGVGSGALLKGKKEEKERKEEEKEEKEKEKQQKQSNEEDPKGQLAQPKKPMESGKEDDERKKELPSSSPENAPSRHSSLESSLTSTPQTLFAGSLSQGRSEAARPLPFAQRDDKSLAHIQKIRERLDEVLPPHAAPDLQERRSIYLAQLTAYQQEANQKMLSPTVLEELTKIEELLHNMPQAPKASEEASKRRNKVMG